MDEDLIVHVGERGIEKGLSNWVGKKIEYRIRGVWFPYARRVEKLGGIVHCS